MFSGNCTNVGKRMGADTRLNDNLETLQLPSEDEACDFRLRACFCAACA